MKVLVTGAAGFLGRNVSKLARANGYEVAGIGHGDLSPEDLSTWGMTAWHQSDVTLTALQELTDAPDLIVHCAGSASVAFSVENPVADFRRTVDSTLAVLEFARTSAKEIRVVLTSSAGVYGLVNQLPIRVEESPNPISPYGLHKKIAEDLCRSYSKNYGIPTAIVRLFSVYGPGLKKQLLWDACRKLTRGEAEFSGTGEETRDWIHVEDASRLLLVAADKASGDAPIVNGGTGESASVKAVLEVLSAKLSDAPSPRFNNSVRAGDPAHYKADIAEATSWGWSPQWHWRDGIGSYATWYSEHGR